MQDHHFNEIEFLKNTLQIKRLKFVLKIKFKYGNNTIAKDSPKIVSSDK